jgi:hypothetical protein
MELPFDLDKTQGNVEISSVQEGGDVTIFTVEEGKRFRLDRGVETGPTLVYEFFALCGVSKYRIVQKPQPSASHLDTGIGPTDLGQLDVLYNQTQEQQDSITPLRVAAKANDEKRFVVAMRSVNWSQLSATDFFNAVHLALEAGAHLAARRLATEGARRYPHSSNLQRMSILLGEPQVVNAKLPPVPSLKANRQWMQDHAAKYQGQWVALKNGRLVASAPTVHELKARVEDLKDHFVVKVF